MGAESIILRLPECLELKPAAPLNADLVAAKGSPVKIDGSRMQRLGGLCLQVLLSAGRSWVTYEKSLRVINPSADFNDWLALFGVASPNVDSSGARL